MNVQLENLPNCITTLHVEVPAEKVTSAWDNIAKEYVQYAKLPGYRPGKAPRAVVEAKYKKEIREEVQKRILTDSTREAIKENNLRVLQLAEVEDVEFGDDKSIRFTATLVTAPAFEMPAYTGLPVEVPSAEVTEKDIEDSIERFREQFADFNDVTGRPAQMDDFVVIDYTGTLDGQPVHEAAKGAGKPLSGNEGFWMKMAPEAFFPGFAEKLVGANVGETREFDIEVASDFPVESLAGKTLHYQVTLKEIKDRILPEVNDEFAAKLAPGKNLEEVRELVRGEVTRQKQFEAEREKRTQILNQLLAQVECELPENMVRSETHRILNEIVRENQSRGVEEDVLKENAGELLASAGQSARDRLKGTFILLRIAELEKVTVTQEEFQRRLQMMAMRYNMPADKLVKELEQRGALEALHEEILTGKVLDFLASSASVAAKAPEATPEPAAASEASGENAAPAAPEA